MIDANDLEGYIQNLHFLLTYQLKCAKKITLYSDELLEVHIKAAVQEIRVFGQ